MNRPDELCRCIDHIRAQTSLPGEVIVVDASNDILTKDRLSKRFAALPFMLRYLRAEEAGMARQRRLGVESTSAEIVLFLDDDVYIERRFVEELLRVFVERDFARIGGVTGHESQATRLPVWDPSYLVRFLLGLPIPGRGKFRFSGLHASANGLRGVRRVQFLGGAFTAYRRDVLLEMPPDGEKFPGPFEDVDLSYRVSRRYQNYYTEYARCVHQPSAINRKSAQERSADMCRYYGVYWEKNIRPTPLRKLARRVASYGMASGLCFMTGKDTVIWMLERILGRHLAGQARALARSFRR
jgi:GT2 family glycosyltransferase